MLCEFHLCVKFKQRFCLVLPFFSWKCVSLKDPLWINSFLNSRQESQKTSKNWQSSSLCNLLVKDRVVCVESSSGNQGKPEGQNHTHLDRVRGVCEWDNSPIIVAFCHFCGTSGVGSRLLQKYLHFLFFSFSHSYRTSPKQNQSVDIHF